MAGEKTVEVEDQGTVTVDISDLPDLDDSTNIQVATGEDAAKLPKQPKVRVSPTKEKEPAADDEAVKALREAVASETTSRKAAEATANAERLQREQAQRELAQQRLESQNYRDRAENNELAIINSGIESAERELLAYKGEFKRAAEAGEFGEMAEVQVKIATAAATLKSFNDAKANFEVNSDRKTTEGRVEAPQIQQAPLEQYLSGFAPKAQQWLRAHPECVPTNLGGDGTKNSKMMQGHYSALGQGIPEGSDDYYRIIEETAGYRQPVSTAAVIKTAGSDDNEVEVKPAAKRTAQPSAPVSREPPEANGTQRARTVREVKLSKDQQDTAKMSFPHLAEKEAFALYARNLIELEAEGKIGRMTH